MNDLPFAASDRSRPLVPEQLRRVEVRGLHAFGRRWDVSAEGTAGSITVEAADPPG